jgi:hypothetical protein
MRFPLPAPWCAVLALAGLFCLPLLLGQAQRLASAAWEEPRSNHLDDLAEVNAHFNREWDLLRSEASDEREREQMRREWRGRYDSALRETHLRHGRDLSSHLQSQGAPQASP